MQLNIKKPLYETSPDLNIGVAFDIKDMGMIFEILKSKLYSNQPLSIIRELYTNAMDSQQVIGCIEPVEITLPNYLEPSLKVKDHGEGISPERFETIYKSLASSTKRENNKLVGCFGIGRLSALSMSSEFTISTNFNKINYQYIIAVDENRMIKGTLLHSEPTEEINGTEVTVPVDPKDFKQFAEWTEFATRHARIRPIIKGCQNFTWKEIAKELEGKDWYISKNKERYSENNIYAIVDGIEYKIDQDIFSKHFKSIELNSNLYLIFNHNPNINLSTSRESLHYTDLTIKTLEIALTNVSNEISKSITEKISTAPNLWEAKVICTKIQKIFHYNLKANVTYNNISINPNETQIDLNNKVTNFYWKSLYRRGNKQMLKQQDLTYLSIYEKSEIFINDLNLLTINARDIRKYFIANDLQYLNVIHPSNISSIEHLNKTIHLDQMNVKLLSSILNKVSKTRTPTVKFNLFKFNGKKFEKSAFKTFKADLNKKVLVTLDKDTHYYPTLNGNKFNNFVQFDKTISFYGISNKKDKKELKNIISLEDYLKNKLKDKDIQIKNKYVYDNNNNISTRFKDVFTYCNKLVTDKSSEFFKLAFDKQCSNLEKHEFITYEALHGKITDKELKDWLNLHQEYDFNKIEKDIIKKYPLMQYLSINYNRSNVKDIAEYINLVNEKG